MTISISNCQFDPCFSLALKGTTAPPEFVLGFIFKHAEACKHILYAIAIGVVATTLLAGVAALLATPITSLAYTGTFFAAATLGFGTLAALSQPDVAQVPI